MGVKFRDIISPESIKFEQLESKIVALDAANIIYQFLSSIRQVDGTPLMDQNGNITSHFSGILYRTSSLIEKGIRPVYIFDGTSDILKKGTQDKRREVKEESQKKMEKALEEGRIEDARKYAVRTSRMSPKIVEGSKKLLELLGVPYIQARGEGEAQASYMVENGDAWCVGSQDYDCILFGATKMVRNLTITGGKSNLELIDLKKVLENLGITREQLVDIAILVGTDFNLGVKGIGAKTGLKLIKEHENIFNVINKLDIEMEVEPEILRNIFLKHEVEPDYSLKWKSPDTEGVVRFLCGDHDFSEVRVLSALDKFKKIDNKQKSLKDWFG
ncbi:flap endonuclease-1 [Methanobacterium spitsbergense]|uniref:Flap endonuclease 1 n=1 Tax=Methanobacterium spitsbergense TaxID=2874285 RepID=A0A8T5UY24_9EURY|nr:flap endonuclease-1 [Methanobacterium spitsbergense]MBZ2165713.1 flap endonuclease-1 [Methanobacterium spitsbergense]